MDDPVEVERDDLILLREAADYFDERNNEVTYRALLAAIATVTKDI